MTDAADYEELDFPPPPKPPHTHYSHTQLPNESSSQPVAPPRTTSRYVERDRKVSGDDKPAPPPPASKPAKRPLPPPKPRTYEALDQEDRPSIATAVKMCSTTGLSHQAQSMDAPSLPPKPIVVASPAMSASFDAAHSPLLRRTMMYKKIGELPGDQMSLCEFVRDHGQELPLRVRVDEGFCGSDERFIISTGDVYNFHFLKKVKVASIADAGGVHFSVPLNSSVKFGMLYNPDNDFRKSIQGYSFETVAALTVAKVCPKLVLSKTECLCTDPKSSVEANELLLITKVGKTALKRRPFIKVVNLRNKQEKTLYDECEGNFTTAPVALQMFLPELLEYLTDSLPLQAMLYVTNETQAESEFPLDLTTEMITLTHTSIETSIVATTYWGDDETGLTEEDFMPLAIPLELEIEITVLKDESEAEDLYSNTTTLLNTFDPLKVKDMAEARTDQMAQTRFYKNVRKGYETSGMQLEKPTRIYDAVGPSPILTRTSPTHQSFFPPPAVPLPTPGRRSPRLRSSERELSPILPKDRKKSDSGSIQPAKSSVAHIDSSLVDHQLSDLHSNTRALKCLLDAMQDNSSKITSDLKSELKRLGRIVENLARNYERLEKQVQDLKQGESSSPTATPQPMYGNIPQAAIGNQSEKVQSEKALPFNPYGITNTSSLVKKTADPDLRAKNKEELASMDCGEILSLLAALNMSQYQKVFLTEQVDGEILCECDDEVLRTELSVTNSIHRKKLMSIVNGSQSSVCVIQNSVYTSTSGDVP